MSLPLSFCSQNPPDYDWKGYNDLRRALSKRDQSLACRLINDGVEVNPRFSDDRYDTPLHLAVMSRCSETTRLLLSKGADIGAKDWNLDTPLTLAAKMENKDLVNILLSHQVQNHENEEYFSHLHVACIMNRVDIVEKLVAKDHLKNINKAVSEHSMFWPGYTPLHFAVHYGCSKTVQCLLNVKADMMIEDSRKLTPLHLAHLQRNVQIVDLLLSAHKHEFKNPVNQQGLSHFHIACSRDDISILSHFMQLGVNIDDSVPREPNHIHQSPWQNFSPIHFAIYHNCPRVVKFLLGINARLDVSLPPLFMEHTFMEKVGSIQDLFNLKRLAAVDMKKQVQEITVMHTASVQNDVEAMEQLLNASADIALDFDAPNPMGLTALHLGIRYNSKEAVTFLLNHKANIFVQDLNGETPVHIAFRYRFIGILELLLENLESVSQNLLDCDRLSIFHILCTTDKSGAIKSLILNGVNMNAQVSSRSVRWAGFTALHFACFFNKTETVKLLLAHNADIMIMNGRNLNPFELIFENLSSKKSKQVSEVVSYLSIVMLHGAAKNFNIEGVSILHAMCINRTLDSKLMYQYISSHRNEINKVTNLPQLRKYNKCTPLHLAILFENYGHANLLLENGANPFALNDEGRTPLECMLLFEFFLPKKSILIENCFALGTSVQTLKPSHFYVACALSLLNFVGSVLHKVSDKNLKMSLINCRDDRNGTPLHFMVNELRAESRVEIIRLLLENGADVDAQDYRLEIPLHSASYYEDFDIVSLLLEYGSDVNTQNIFGETPLHKISMFDYASDERVIISLLDQNPDINLLDTQDRTSLMILQQDLQDGDRELIDNYDGFQICVISYLKHIKKLQSMGSYISDENFRAYSKSMDLLGDDGFGETAFVDECKKELDKMQAVHLDRYTTLRDILFKNANEMVFHCDNVKLQSLVASNDFSAKYPIYGSIVKSQLKNGRIRRPLLIESKKCLSTMIGVQLPQSCLETILHYFSNKDLNNMIASENLCR